VVGEHGTSEVLSWSTANGQPPLDVLDRKDQPLRQLRRDIENDVREERAALEASAGILRAAATRCEQARQLVATAHL
jgi:malate/lactate dehydrogenase